MFIALFRPTLNADYSRQIVNSLQIYLLLVGIEPHIGIILTKFFDKILE
jgi:hypothetical protein